MWAECRLEIALLWGQVNLLLSCIRCAHYVSCIELHELHVLVRISAWDAWFARVGLRCRSWNTASKGCVRRAKSPLFIWNAPVGAKKTVRMSISPKTKGFQKSFEKHVVSVEIYVFGEITNITAPWKHTAPYRSYYHHFYEDFFLCQIFLSGKHISIVRVWSPEEDSDNNGRWGPTDALRPTTSTIFIFCILYTTIQLHCWQIIQRKYIDKEIYLSGLLSIGFWRKW